MNGLTAHNVFSLFFVNQADMIPATAQLVITTLADPPNTERVVVTVPMMSHDLLVSIIAQFAGVGANHLTGLDRGLYQIGSG